MKKLAIAFALAATPVVAQSAPTPAQMQTEISAPGITPTHSQGMAGSLTEAQILGLFQDLHDVLATGVTCSGAPSTSFAVTNGIVIHC